MRSHTQPDCTHPVQQKRERRETAKQARIRRLEKLLLGKGYDGLEAIDQIRVDRVLDSDRIEELEEQRNHVEFMEQISFFDKIMKAETPNRGITGAARLGLMMARQKTKGATVMAATTYEEIIRAIHSEKGRLNAVTAYLSEEGKGKSYGRFDLPRGFQYQ